MPISIDPWEHAYDGYLYPWAEIAELFDDGGLLVGNGASQAVWTEFGYSSLYQEASSPTLVNPLTAEDKALFSALGDTKNFEAVLRDLRVAAVIESALGKPDRHLLDRYENIQKALVQTVHKVHVGWNPVAPTVLPKLRI